jgi:hypothetical protein
MRLCGARPSHFPRAKFILNFWPIGEQSFRRTGNDVGSVFKWKWKSNMLNKLLGAAAMAAVTFAVVPAHAAKMGGGCSSANLTKTETMIEGITDGDGKMMAQKELSAAQDAMLGGKMGACGMHLSKAMHAGMGK